MVVGSSQVSENNQNGPENLHRIEAEIDASVYAASNWKRLRPRSESPYDKDAADTWNR